MTTTAYARSTPNQQLLLKQMDVALEALDCSGSPSFLKARTGFGCTALTLEVKSRGVVQGPRSPDLYSALSYWKQVTIAFRAWGFRV